MTWSIWLPIVISVIAIIVSTVTLWLTHFKKAEINASLGDSFGLVRHSYNSEGEKSIHLHCTFINEGAQTGVIEKLEVRIRQGDKSPVIFDWKVFFRYLDLTASAQEPPHSVPVLSRQVAYSAIQFTCQDSFKWDIGNYKLELLGWVNKNCKEDPTFRHVQEFTIDKKSNENLEHGSSPAGPVVYRIKFKGYDLKSAV